MCRVARQPVSVAPGSGNVTMTVSERAAALRAVNMSPGTECGLGEDTLGQPEAHTDRGDRGLRLDLGQLQAAVSPGRAYPMQAPGPCPAGLCTLALRAAEPLQDALRSPWQWKELWSRQYRQPRRTLREPLWGPYPGPWQPLWVS